MGRKRKKIYYPSSQLNNRIMYTGANTLQLLLMQLMFPIKKTTKLKRPKYFFHRSKEVSHSRIKAKSVLKGLMESY